MAKPPPKPMSPDEIREAASGFYQTQIERCTSLGIDVGGLPVGHLAYRCRTWSEYVRTRDALELQCRGNLENVWNGRPISKMLLRDPIRLSRSKRSSIADTTPGWRTGIWFVPSGVGAVIVRMCGWVTVAIESVSHLLHSLGSAEH